MSEKKKFDMNMAKLERIDILQAAMVNDTDAVSIKDCGYIQTMEYSFNPGVNVANNRIRIIFNMNVTTEDKDGNNIEISAKFNFSFVFVVDNLSDLVNINELDNEKVPAIDLNMFVNLSSMAYSTARGIIFTRSQGSVFNNLILPVLPNARIEDLLKESGIGKHTQKDD